MEQEYLTALIQLCTEVQMVTNNKIKTLASARALIIKSYLLNEKSVEPHRITVGENQEISSDDTALVKTKLEVIVE